MTDSNGKETTPEHIRNIISALTEGLPIASQEIAREVCEHIYRGGYIDGRIAGLASAIALGESAVGIARAK